MTAATPPKGRVKRIVLLITALIVIVVGAVAAYQPLKAGSTTRAHEAGLLLSTAADNGANYEYRYAPGALFYTAFSIRNTGPLPVEILGVDLSPYGDQDLTQTALLWGDELLLAFERGSTELWTDPASAPPAAGTVIDPGMDLVMWVRWRVGGRCAPGEAPPVEAGGGLGQDGVDVRWSVLGIPRSARFPVGYEVLARNPESGPLTVCPPAP